MWVPWSRMLIPMPEFKYMCLVSRLRKSWADEGKCLFEGMREGVKAVSVTSRYSSGHKCCTALRWLAVCLSFRSCNPVARNGATGVVCQLPTEVCTWPERSCVVTTLYVLLALSEVVIVSPRGLGRAEQEMVAALFQTPKNRNGQAGRL